MAIPPVATSVIAAVAANEVGKAAGANGMLRELGGVFGVAVTVAVFAGAGGYTSAEAFTDGFVRAIGVAAQLSLAGALAAWRCPAAAQRNRRTTESRHMPSFPGESPEYRTARDALLEREVGCAGRWRPWPSRGGSSRRAGSCRRTTCSRAPDRTGSPRTSGCRSCSPRQGLARDLQLHVSALAAGPPARPRERAVGRAAAGAGPVPVVHGAVGPARRGDVARGAATHVLRGGRSADRARAHVRAGARVAAPAGCCQRPATRTSATTTARPTTAHRSRS